jgi:hypothetical protein
MATSSPYNWRNEMKHEDRIKVCAMPPLRRDFACRAAGSPPDGRGASVGGVRWTAGAASFSDVDSNLRVCHVVVGSSFFDVALCPFSRARALSLALSHPADLPAHHEQAYGVPGGRVGGAHQVAHGAV